MDDQPMPITNDHLPAGHQGIGDVPSNASPPPVIVATAPPKLPPLMDFYKAIALTLQGFRITRLEWNNEAYYGHLKDSWLAIHKPDGNDHPWTISDGDMLANDWLVVAQR